MSTHSERTVHQEAPVRTNTSAASVPAGVEGAGKRPGVAAVYEDVLSTHSLMGSELERACFEQYEKLNWHANITVAKWVRHDL